MGIIVAIDRSENVQTVVKEADELVTSFDEELQVVCIFSQTNLLS